jgi:hypothetical protein
LTSMGPSARDLRIFAAIVATGFACVGAFSYYRHRVEPSQTTALVLWSIGGTILVVGLVAPVLLRPFHRFWVALGHVLGYVNTRIILALTFFGLFLPFGWGSRLLRRDPLRLTKARGSHWVRRDEKPIDHTRMF